MQNQETQSSWLGRIGAFAYGAKTAALNLTGYRFSGIRQIKGARGLGQLPAFYQTDGEGILTLLGEIHTVMEEEGIDKCIFWLGPKPVLVLANPTDIRQFKVNHEDKLDLGVPLLDEFLGDVILNESLEDWKKERKIMIELAHKSTNLRAIFPKIQAIAQTHIERAVDTGASIDFKTFFNSYVLDVFTTTLMGVETDEETLKGFVDILDDLTKTVFQFRGVFKFMLPAWIRAIAYPGEANDLDQIREQMKERFCSFAKITNAAPLLEKLNEAFYHSETVSVEEQFGRLLFLISAGSATTGATLQFAITMLEAHPDVKAKLLAELADVDIDTLNLESMDEKSLPYLNHFINEVWRLFPPTPFYLPRETAIPFELNLDNGQTLHIEKGDLVMGTPFLVGHSSAVHTDPKIFNPDRFMENNEPKPSPFSMGSRECPGRNLAKLEIKTMLIALLKTANLTLDNVVENKTEIDLTFRGSMTPKMDLIGSIHNIGELPQNNSLRPKS